jgi:hypothetical protein
MFGASIIVIFMTVIWSLGHMIPFFWLLKHYGMLRVSEEDELLGLDIASTGGTAYRGASRHGGHHGLSHPNHVVCDTHGDIMVGNDIVGRVVNLENRNVDLERQLFTLKIKLEDEDKEK